jgi:hypothetical protein
MCWRKPVLSLLVLRDESRLAFYRRELLELFVASCRSPLHCERTLEGTETAGDNCGSQPGRIGMASWKGHLLALVKSPHMRW